MVNGIAQGGRKPKDLETIWVETLQEGFAQANESWPKTVKFDFPYYGDTLDGLVAQARLPTPSSLVAKGSSQNGDFEQFMQSALEQLQTGGSISDDAVRALAAPGQSQQKGPQNWGWVQAIARAIDKRLTPASSFTIEAFLQEVFLYVAKPDVARQINTIVEAMLTREPTIVIGHSLGSVVAYNVIRANLQRLDLRKFITVGSPLGLRAVSSKLGVAENPAGADGWYNAFDERDIVALNPLDDEYFPAEPGIVNDGQVDNNTDNRHGIIGYLNDAKVAAKVAAAIVP